MKRHWGCSGEPRFLHRASSFAASCAEGGRPASCSGLSMMSSQALVASRTFSEYFWVRRASSDSIVSRRFLEEGSSSAPFSLKSARTSSRKRLRMGERDWAAWDWLKLLMVA